MPASTRPGVRIAANRYARGRASLYLQRKFFRDLLDQLGDTGSRDVRGAIESARQIPSLLRELKDQLREVARAWAILEGLSQQPQEEYVAALGRAIHDLSRARRQEQKARLVAYQALSRDGSSPDLDSVQDEVEELAERIREAIQDRSAAKREKVAGRIAGFLQKSFD